MKKYRRIVAIITFAITLFLMPAVQTTALSAGSESSATVMATTSNHVTINELSTKAKLSWPWYVTRASGLLAAVLLLLLILSGIGQITGFTYRLMEPLMAWTLHRALAISLGVCILIHGGVLLFDKYAPFSILNVLVPFTSHYTPVTIFGLHVGSLYVAYGILAFYVAAIIILTSLFWMTKKPKIWRLLHYLGYVLVVLVFLHGLYLGTDIAHGPGRVVWWISGIIIGVGIASRLRRVWTIKQDDTKV